jgi:hypothetical protein
MREASLPESFIATLQALIDWLQAEKVPHTIIGGVAISIVAQPRTTQDIDVVIWLDESRWKGLLTSGEAYGFMPRLSDALEFAFRSRVLLLRHQASGISIDISCGALDFEREMIARSATLEIGELKIKVPTPEDLIITKIVAHRPKDLADIEAILSIRQNLDLAHIKHWTSKFAEALGTPELLENLERLLNRYRKLK